MSESGAEITEKAAKKMPSKRLYKKLSQAGSQAAAEFGFELRGQAERNYEVLDAEARRRDERNIRKGLIPGQIKGPK